MGHTLKSRMRRRRAAVDILISYAPGGDVLWLGIGEMDGGEVVLR